MWEYLPDILLENIYSFISMKDRYACSIVCKNWCRVLYYPRVWRRLEVGDTTFKRKTYINLKHFKDKRLNMYRVLRDELCRQNIRKYLDHVGRYVRHLKILPMTDLNIMYQFMKIVSDYIEKSAEYPMHSLQVFEFTFPCEQWGSILFGTGGKLLKELKRLLSSFRGLTKLIINNLLLQIVDISGLLDNVVVNCPALTYLEGRNYTKKRCPLLHVVMFRNLQTLVISPLQLTEEMALMLAGMSTLKMLIIVQDKYSGQTHSLSQRVWQDIKLRSPQLRVRCEQGGSTRKNLRMQKGAPVQGIVYHTPYSRVKAEHVRQVVKLYRDTLEVYGHLGLPRQSVPRSFQERADLQLVHLVRECPSIRTLAIRERVSTATLLVLAAEASELRQFYVRRNAVIIRCDWPEVAHWKSAFYQELKTKSRSYDLVEKEITEKVGYKWRMLSDAEFKTIVI